jgi:transposase
MLSRMATNFDARTDSQWALITELMDQKLAPERGTPRASFRKVWNSILYVLGRACRWVDTPADRATNTARATAHAWMLGWQHEGVFDRVLSGLLHL